MNTFIQKYQPQIKGTLSGWDRIVFRGTIRTLAYIKGMASYLQRIGCLLKDFGEHVENMTGQLPCQCRGTRIYYGNTTTANDQPANT